MSTPRSFAVVKTLAMLATAFGTVASAATGRTLAAVGGALVFVLIMDSRFKGGK